MLGILSHFDLSNLPPLGAKRFHLAVEAGRLAVADRDRLVGDAGSSWGLLLDKNYQRERASLIDPNTASDPKTFASPFLGRHTCHVAVVDRDLNSISLISSLFSEFGSGIIAPGTGVLLQNRGRGFVLEEGHPNEVGPSKRPLHTIIPSLIYRDDQVSHVMGLAGGYYQPWGHTHFVTNLVDFGMDVQEALDAPRLFHNGTAVEVERGVAPGVVQELADMGHVILNHGTPTNEQLEPLGCGQLIQIDRTRGTLSGGADPRFDGCAMGL